MRFHVHVVSSTNIKVQWNPVKVTPLKVNNRFTSTAEVGPRFLCSLQGCHASFTRPRETAILKKCPREIGVLVPIPCEAPSWVSGPLVKSAFFVPSPRETPSWVSGPLLKSAFWCPALVKCPRGYRNPREIGFLLSL